MKDFKELLCITSDHSIHTSVLIIDPETCGKVMGFSLPYCVSCEEDEQTIWYDVTRRVEEKYDSYHLEWFNL